VGGRHDPDDRAAGFDDGRLAEERHGPVDDDLGLLVGDEVRSAVDLFDGQIIGVILMAVEDLTWSPVPSADCARRRKVPHFRGVSGTFASARPKN
jgi:hypothetical protein